MTLYSIFMRFLGLILSCAVYVILSAHVYGFMSVIARVIKKRLGVFFGLVWISIGLSLVYNIVFNHFWAMVIKPGGPSDLLDNEQLRKEIKNRESRKEARVNTGEKPRSGTAEAIAEDDRFEGLQKDVKRLMKYRTKTMGNLRGFWNRRCAICNDLKPARTHHCSVTGRCVFQFNGFCVFINNCVGLENQRFFLLFILYSMIGAGYNLISIISIWNHYIYKEKHQLMSFLLIFDSLAVGCLFFYNLWSWFLACSGLTAVEFIGRNTGYKTNHYDFTFSRIRDNLFKVFGTKSYFQILSPSLRYNPFNGIEWSFQMKDLGFNEFGELAAGENDEENLAKPQTEMTSINSTQIVPDHDADGTLEEEDAEIAL